MSFVILKPKLFALKNAYIKRSFYSAGTVRDSIIAALALVMMYLVYRGTMWAITHINANPSLMYLPPSYPLGMILALLLFMICMSGIAVAVGALFLSQDLDLILATPVSKAKLFFGKLFLIIISASWMPLLFLSPLLFAFGRAYDAPFSFYLLAFVILAPFFILAGSISSILAILISRLVPASRSREILFLVGCTVLILLFILVDLMRLGFGDDVQKVNLSRMISFLSMANVPWLPSHWTAACLQDAILGRDTEWPKYLPLLLFSSLAGISLAQIIFYTCHFDTYTRSQSVRSNNHKTPQIRSALLPASRWIAQPQRALVGKEILHFLRDVTHTIQLLMLLGLCAVYIFNLRIFLNIEAFPFDSREWWQKFFFISNSSIAAFVTTGFCTRFVFVSLSLEGKALWILETSPLSMTEILQAKFRSWLMPVALLGSIVFCAAGLSLNVGPYVMALSMVSSWFICYGIVGLAIGLGARYANFSWEHSSQLAAGFGNMVFMLASIALISLNLIPACIMLFNKNAALEPYLIISMMLMIFCINYSAKVVAFRFGIESLKNRFEMVN